MRDYVRVVLDRMPSRKIMSSLVLPGAACLLLFYPMSSIVMDLTIVVWPIIFHSLKALPTTTPKKMFYWLTGKLELGEI
jgi:hypothetical protein